MQGPKRSPRRGQASVSAAPQKRRQMGARPNARAGPNLDDRTWPKGRSGHAEQAATCARKRSISVGLGSRAESAVDRSDLTATVAVEVADETLAASRLRLLMIVMEYVLGGRGPAMQCLGGILGT